MKLINMRKKMLSLFNKTGE